MRKYVWIIIFSVVCSCSSKDKAQEEIEYSNTEEIQAQATTDVISFSKRRNDDIVEHLHRQAIQRDEDLRLLDERMEGISDIKTDSLAAFAEYMNYNDLYYSVVDRYINSIQDSMKRKASASLLALSKSDFEKRTEGHMTELARMSTLERQLSDQTNLMKLIISGRLIYLYQQDIPQKGTLEGINTQFEELIIETEKYTNPDR